VQEDLCSGRVGEQRECAIALQIGDVTGMGRMIFGKGCQMVPQPGFCSGGVFSRRLDGTMFVAVPGGEGGVCVRQVWRMGE
jgi:hypothetical protein